MVENVRPMLLADLTKVVSLVDQLGYPNEKEFFEERFQKISQLSNHSLFVVDKEGIKGWIHLEAVEDFIEETKVEIKALVVDEKERGQSIGAMLMRRAREWAKTYGVSTIYLSCNIIRNEAHAFYLKEGLQKVKTSHFFEAKI